jgi:Tfp pilus assembly protein PilF
LRRIGTVLVLALVLLIGACSDDGADSSQTSAQKATKQVQQGLQQQQSGQLEAAQQSFLAATVTDPKNKFAWYNLGLIAQLQQNKGQAVQYYDKAIAIDPVFTSALYNKAILIEGDQPDAAIALYRQILAVKPDASTTYLHLGLLLDQKGETTQAREAFAQALKLDPSLASLVPAKYRAAAKSNSPTPTPTAS